MTFIDLSSFKNIIKITLIIILLGPNEESLTWVDESVYVDKRLDRSQKTHSHTRTDPLGIFIDF